MISDGEVHKVEGKDWWIEIGPVSMEGTLVTIQKKDKLIAAITSRDDGRLRVSVFDLLDGKSASILIALSKKPHPEFGVGMRDNNWEYVLDNAAGIGNAYAADRGESYLSFWEKGIGILGDGTESEVYRPYKDLVASDPRMVATQLMAYCESSEEVSGRKKRISKKKTIAKKEGVGPNIPLWKPKRQQRRTVQDRFLGCMLGGAVGDALGAPVEFLKRSEILSRFGPDGITNYEPAYGGLGTITDDTQMTMFTAEGLLRGWVRGCFKGITTYSGVTAHAYLRWLCTQGDVNPCSINVGLHEPGWLFQQQELHSQRAPGNTCLSALRAMKSFGMPAKNNSKGCGGVMRVAPVGLFCWQLRHQQSPHDAFRLATELAALTHGHPTGSLAGGVLAVLVMALADGVLFQEALFCAKACLRLEPHHEETLAAIELAEELVRSSLAPESAINKIGRGWIAEEALAISIYCSLMAKSFRHGIIMSVNHDGDSDSTGSIAGNMLGAIYGVKAIPSEWLDPLELRAVITELTEDLHSFRTWDIGEYSENVELNQRIWKKYPGF